MALAINLAQSLTKGWPSTEPFTRKKRVVKDCVNIIEANDLDELSMRRYRSIEQMIKAI